jgi:hypothetical protein
MAISDRNIVITPNVSATGPAQPKIVFTGADSSIGDSAAITLFANPENSGTLSFSGSQGQLFSVTNSLSGTIFAVGDISGIPSLEIDDAGIVKIAEYNGRVLIGGATDDSSSVIQASGTIKATTFSGSGASLTSLNASNLSSGTVPSARLSASDLLTLIKTVDGAGSGLDADQLDGISSGSFLRSDTSDQKTGGDTRYNDNIELYIGSGNDTNIVHQGSYTRFSANTSTGGMSFEDGSTRMFDVAVTAANTTTFFQTADFTNATVTGISAGAVDGIFLEYEKTVSSNYTIDNGVTALTACNDSDGITIASGITVTISDSSGWVLTNGDKNMGLDAMIGASNQTERTMRTGTIKPTLNNTYDLGDSAVAWRNIYTNDLNLSNETGNGNDVDGTTGKWTIQEGEENLYIINRKTGKKYKFMLEEIV